MKHLIFGTGLIGGFVGGGLIKAGLDVAFLGRDKQREAMQDGLIVSALEVTEHELPAPIFFSDDSHTRQESIYDVIWLTVKATAVKSCVEQLSNLATDSTVIICCQNGFGSDAPLRAALKNQTILNATVGFNVAQQTPNHLHRSTDGHLVIESHPKLTGLAEKINCDLLPCHEAQDIEAERWAKLQLNLANPVNALADVPTKTMAEDPDYRKVIITLMNELLAITKAKGLKLPKLTALPATWLPRVMGLPNMLYLKLAQKTLAIDPTARVSMWWDLSQNKPTEIQFLNQAVVNAGLELGIDCPINQRIVALIKKVEHGEVQIGISGSELQSLLGLRQ